MTIDPDFQALLSALVAAMAGDTAPSSAPADPGLYGLEFESGEHALRLGQHPGQSAMVLLEVDVLPAEALQPSDERPLWRWLHQFNHEALRAEGWVASVDDEGVLVLQWQGPWAGLGVADLQALMSEGLQQAEDLARQCREPQAEPDAVGALPLGSNALMG